MTTKSNYNNEVLLEKSESDWISAKWNKSVGIYLTYKRPNSSLVFHDNELFLSFQKTVQLFQHFSKGLQIETEIKWIDDQNTISLKTQLRKIDKRLEFVFLTLVSAVIFYTLFQYYFHQSASSINDFLNDKLYLVGLFNALIGFWGISYSYIDFVYKNDNESITSSYFLLGCFTVFLGTIMIIVHYV